MLSSQEFYEKIKDCDFKTCHEEFNNFLKNDHKNYTKTFYIALNSNLAIKEKIKSLTENLDNIYENLSNGERALFILLGIEKEEDIPLCEVCGKKRSYDRKNRIFRLTCGNNFCFQNHPQTNEKRKNTIIKHYGSYDNFSKEVLQTSIFKKYGVGNISSLDEIKEKKKKTCKNNFGVDHPMQSKKVRDKSIETNLERYGVENVSQSIPIALKKLNSSKKMMIDHNGNHIAYEGNENILLEEVFNMYKTEVEIHPKISIAYTDNSNKQHYWFPDAINENKKILIELKNFIDERHVKELHLKFKSGILNGYKCILFLLYQERIYILELIDIEKNNWSVIDIKRSINFDIIKKENFIKSKIDNIIILQNLLNKFNMYIIESNLEGNI